MIKSLLLPRLLTQTFLISLYDNIKLAYLELPIIFPTEGARSGQRHVRQKNADDFTQNYAFRLYILNFC